MVENNPKIDQFLEHLLSLPVIKKDCPIGAEQQIITFIKTNLPKLEVSFTRPEFFPNLPPRETIAYIISTLQKRVVDQSLNFFKKVINSEIDLSILRKVRKRPVNEEVLKEKIISLMEEMLLDPITRLQLKPVYYILQTKYIDKIINLLFERKAFTYNELVRVQKCYIEAGEYISYLKILLLFSQFPNFQKENKKILLNAATNEEKIQICTNSSKILARKIPEMDIIEFKLAVDSNLPENLLEIWEASSRLLFILLHRFNEYDPNLKIEKGAETPDKSWFGVARKIAKDFGYSRGIIDELFLIANEIK
ncbi:MAG: hypothetical protein ACK4YF_04085 [Exilispira sp.]